MTSSNGNIFRVTGPLWGESSGYRWIPLTRAMQWRGALMFSFTWVSTNGWTNNRRAGDLRRHRAHYDVTVTVLFQPGLDLMGALVCMCRVYRSVHRDVPCVFVCIGMGARACDRHIPNVPTQTYRHIRDKMAVVAVNLAAIPDSLATFLVVNSEKLVWRYQLFAQSKRVSRDQQKSYHGPVWVHFGLPIITYTDVSFLRKGGAWHHRWMLKVTSCGRKCTANKQEPGSAQDRRHIMTSPGYTGISRRDMQTSAPHVCVPRSGEQQLLFVLSNLEIDHSLLLPAHNVDAGT